MGRVAVLGSFMMDMVVRADRRPLPGETLVGTGFAMSLGGKGFNQAVAAVRAGAETAMIGRLGHDDLGREFLACLAGEGIDTRFVARDPDEGTGVGAPLVDAAGDNSIVIVPRANANLSVDDVDRAADAIAGADVLLVQLELPVEAVVAAARHAALAGTTVVLNPAPAVVPLERFAGLVNVVVPNYVEARALARGLDEAADPLAVASALQDLSGADVVVTLGADGALVLSADGPASVPSHPVDVADTVGAGDAFCGALGARLAAGDSLQSAAAYANAAAALAVTREGAGRALPTHDEIAGLLELSTAR